MPRRRPGLPGRTTDAVGFHPYCIAPAGSAPPPALRGLRRRPVRSLAVADVRVWASELASAPEPDADLLRIHDRVIRSATEEVASVLPIRFGGWAPSREALDERVRPREEEYRAALRRLAGSREFGVRILDPAGASPSGERVRERPSSGQGRAGPGRAYLEAVARRRAARRRRTGRADEALEALREAVEGRARDERVERPPPDRGLVAVAHLVDEAEIGRYRRAVEGFGRSRPELRTVVTGPWAPYSFAP